jgi:hypothetical protein
MSRQVVLHHILPVKRSLKGNPVRVGRVFFLLVFIVSLFASFPTRAEAATAVSFSGGELLGKPTDTSITINIVPDAAIEYYYEYGTSPGTYTHETPPLTAPAGEAHEVVISGLSPNTRYYYHMIYDGDLDVNDGNYIVRDEHTFHTQRARGEGFVFTITSDSHAQFNDRHRQAMVNVLADQPDFNLDLGDTFFADNTSSQSEVDAAYLAYRDPLYMGKIGPSVPIFLTPGNHEEEEGWNLDDSPFSSGVGSIQARKAFYPTPVNDGFYSGNTHPLPEINQAIYGDELREDYYAWEWGDALFVVIDEYQYTPDLPYTPTAGEGFDDPVTGDQWSWTLGDIQFTWFKQTIQNSPAKYKFVFSHHMLGGTPDGGPFADPGYVRGGAEAAAYFEWGGKNANGTEGFAAHRAEEDFGTKPVHQLMVENGVSAYFHGHDHQYVYETRDGIVYQLVPSPSMTGSGFSGIYSEGNHGDYQTTEIQDNAGHLRLTVDPAETTVEYVRSYLNGSLNDGDVTYTYSITPNSPCSLTAVASSAWSSDGTWDDSCPSPVPNALTDVYIPAGHTVTYDGEMTTVGSLTVEVGGTLQFPGGGTLTVLGDLAVSGGVLDLGAAGELVVEGSLVNNGRLIQTRVVETGESTEASVTFLDYGGYGGLTLTGNTGSPGSTTVEITGGQACDTDDSSVERCFKIRPTNSVADAGLVFHYLAGELNGSTCGTMEAWRSLGGTSWTGAGTVGTRSCGSEPYWVEYSGVTIQNTGSIFSLRSSSAPTAITLTVIKISPTGEAFVITGAMLALTITLALLFRKQLLGLKQA